MNILRWSFLSIVVGYDYEHTPKACVNGHGLELYHEMSVEDCKSKCNEREDCLAFEYGVFYDGKSTPSFKPRDCYLQNGADPSGCDGVHWNFDLYVKKGIHEIYSHSALLFLLN